MASDGFNLCDIMEDCALLLLGLTGVILGWSSLVFVYQMFQEFKE